MLYNWDIKMAVMKSGLQTLEAAYQKWKIWLDACTEYEDKPKEVCHSRMG